MTAIVVSTGSITTTINEVDWFAIGDGSVYHEHVNPERSFRGTNGGPSSEARRGLEGGSGGPPPEIKKNLYCKWCNLSYS